MTQNLPRDQSGLPRLGPTPDRRFFSDGRLVWYIDTIWKAAHGLPVEECAVESLREWDQVCWFSDAWGKRPTCRAVVDHCRRIMTADPSFPIILGPNGELLDGLHRAAKVLAEGKKTLPCIRLPSMPKPDAAIARDDPRYEAPETL